jgi:uncharacterized protein
MRSTPQLMVSLTVLCLVVADGRAVAQTPAPPPVVVAQGEAALKRAPDRAWLSVATETRDPTAAEARRKDAAAMTAVQAALRGAGLGADAIRTTGYALSPEMEWKDGRGTLRGYVVRNQIEVRVDDLDALPAILDTVNSPRDVAISVSGPRFDLKDTSAVEHEALRIAVRNAMARAEALADGAGRTLGPIVRLEEQNLGAPAPRPMVMAMRASAAQETPTPIVPGEIEIHVAVTLTVEIR